MEAKVNRGSGREEVLEFRRETKQREQRRERKKLKLRDGTNL